MRDPVRPCADLVLRRIPLPLVVAALATAAFVHPSPARAQQKKLSEKSSSWSTDLRDAGFVPLPVPVVSPGEAIATALAHLASSLRIGYLDDHTIFVSYVRRNDLGGLQQRGNPGRERPYTLYAIFLDAASGKVLRKQSWPSDIPDAFVAPRDDGNYIVFDAAQVSSFDQTGALLKQVPLAGPRNHFLDLWGISVSETGRTMFVQLHSDTDTDCEWIDTMTMTDNADSCKLPDDVAITDRELAFSGQQDAKPHAWVVSDSKLGGEWQAMCSSDKIPECHGVTFFHGTLLIRSPRGMAILTAPSTVAETHDFPANMLPSGFATARAADELSVALLPSLQLLMSPGLGTANFYEMAAGQGTAQIEFFDAFLHKRPVQIETKYDMTRSLRTALSPNGNQALVFSLDTLRAYALPEPAPAK